MLTILPIIQLAITLIGGILQNKGVIGAATDNLITTLSAAASSLISSVNSKTTGIQDTMAILGTLAGVVATLKTNTNLSPDLLALVASADTDIQASLAGYVQAGKGFDITAYAPVALV